MTWRKHCRRTIANLLFFLGIVAQHHISAGLTSDFRHQRLTRVEKRVDKTLHTFRRAVIQIVGLNW